MGHYASEMGYESNSLRVAMYVRFRDEHNYANVANLGSHRDYDAENTMVHHVPCGLIVGDMVRHLEFCPAKNDPPTEDRPHMSPICWCSGARH